MPPGQTKKILIFSLAYHPCYGGAEIAIKEITDRISSTEIEFHMVTVLFDRAHPRTEKIGNVFVHRIGPFAPKNSKEDFASFPLISFRLRLNKIFFQFFAPVKAFILYRKYHYDFMWAMMPHSTGIPSVLFKFIHPRIPYLLTLQEGDTLSDIKKSLGIFVPLYALSFRRADCVQTISNHLANMAREMGYKGDIRVIPNGVDVEFFSKKHSEAELDSLRRTQNLKKENTCLITTSRLVPKNGIKDVIDALPLLPENIHFLIVGRGSLEIEFRNQATKRGVSSRTHFFGEVSYKEISKYLHLAQVFIRPSLSEGMGNSFIEAMAAGLPVIATQEGGIADFLFDAKRNPDKETTGWAVDKDSPEQIAEAVKDILAHSEQTQQVIASAKKLVIEKYDWDLIAKNMREKVFVPLLKN